jgi:hypothetical protein
MAQVLLEFNDCKRIIIARADDIKQMAAYREQLTTIYKKHEPDKVGSVEYALHKYRGSEAQFLKLKREEHNIDEPTDQDTSAVSYVFKIDIRPYRCGKADEGPDLSIMFHNKCEERNEETKKLANVRCSSWFVVWKVSNDEFHLPVQMTKDDEKFGLTMKVMIQLSNDYVLGYVWCTGTKRHSTIMQHFQCAYAAVISGEWHYDMPVSQKKPYEKKRKAGLIHFGGDRPVSSTIPRQQRGGKSMMMQLMFNEFRKAIFDKQCDRFLQYWDYRRYQRSTMQVCAQVPSAWRTVSMVSFTNTDTHSSTT